MGLGGVKYLVPVALEDMVNRVIMRTMRPQEWQRSADEERCGRSSGNHASNKAAYGSMLPGPTGTIRTEEKQKRDWDF